MPLPSASGDFVEVDRQRLALGGGILTVGVEIS